MCDCDVRAGLGEEPAAPAEDNGDDDGLDLVDEEWSSSARIRAPLPCTCSAPPRLAFSSPTAAARSSERTGVSAHCGSGSVVDARYLGVASTRRNRMAARIHGAPVGGEEVVGPPAERERVGALAGLGDELQGLGVARPQSPSAALEPVPAVLVRRAAVSLNHAIDSDLR